MSSPTTLSAPTPVTRATVTAGQVYRDAGAARRGATRPRAPAYREGLLSGDARKHGWPRAEISGDATPLGLPHRLGRAVGSAVGVVRQDRGTASQVAHGPVGVFLA